jgi:hypothetical protein
LQSMGYRVNANFLRSAAPYIAPTAEGQAQEVFEAFLKNPANKALLEQHPEQIETISILFDRDGDGSPEQVPLKDVAAIAKMPFGTDASGKIVVYPKGTTPDDKASADGILQTLIAQATTEGKQITPELKLKLQQQALQMAGNATRAPKEAPQGLPTNQQRRVDALAKGFDTQPMVRNAQVMAEAVSFAQSLNPTTNNPADDQALIYAFAKAMDPNSVVREGEYATVQKYAQSWAQTFGFNATRLFSNTAFLTPQARANMKATILAKFKAGQGQYNNLRRSYAERINRITGTGDGDTYLTDYGGSFPDEAPAEQTPAATSARDKLRQR